MKVQRSALAILSLIEACLPDVRSAATLPKEPPIQPASSFTLTNVSIDPRLQVIAKFTEFPLRKSSVFMNAVDLLATLAAKDYNGRISETTSSVPGFTDVEIQIRPHQPAQYTYDKFAVLGLYYAIATMTNADKFLSASFGVLWEAKHVAWIWVQPPDYGNQAELQALQDQMESLAGAALAEASLDLDHTAATVWSKAVSDVDNSTTTNINKTINTAVDADVELYISFYPQGTPLMLESVFITIMATLQDVAQYDSDSVAEGFEIGVRAFNCRIQWEKANAGSNGPPSFEYRWIIEAAKQIPVWMMQHRWAESFFTLVVNGYVVGQGAIFSGTSPGFGLEWGTLTGPANATSI